MLGQGMRESCQLLYCGLPVLGGSAIAVHYLPHPFFVPYTSNPSVSTEKIILKGLSGAQQPLSSHQKMGSLEFL